MMFFKKMTSKQKNHSDRAMQVGYITLLFLLLVNLVGEYLFEKEILTTIQIFILGVFIVFIYEILLNYTYKITSKKN
ncbi:hypothetical protein [Bacillus sp. THAF10]|uniref:hypothetical protein n=1 Tax=Bacillus sp. THAF10 TaxID=2587848 RepID=UPI00126987D6|nr:hypothetical protein [Bacillus sp. THAF10]